MMKRKIISLALAAILLFVSSTALADQRVTCVDHSTMHTTYAISDTASGPNQLLPTGNYVNHIVGTEDSGRLTKTFQLAATSDISGNASGYGTVFCSHNSSLGLTSQKNLTVILMRWHIDSSRITGRYEIRGIATTQRLTQRVKLIESHGGDGSVTSYLFEKTITAVPHTSSHIDGLLLVYAGTL